MHFLIGLLSRGNSGYLIISGSEGRSPLTKDDEQARYQQKREKGFAAAKPFSTGQGQRKQLARMYQDRQRHPGKASVSPDDYQPPDWYAR